MHSVKSVLARVFHELVIREWRRKVEGRRRKRRLRRRGKRRMRRGKE